MSQPATIVDTVMKQAMLAESTKRYRAHCACRAADRHSQSPYWVKNQQGQQVWDELQFQADQTAIAEAYISLTKV